MALQKFPPFVRSKLKCAKKTSRARLFYFGEMVNKDQFYRTLSVSESPKPNLTKYLPSTRLTEEECERFEGAT